MKRSLSNAFIALAFLMSQSVLLAQTPDAVSEETKSRPVKQEVTGMMIQIGKMPALQQSDRVDRILADQTGSKTPRSDFMFCIGLAHLGNAKAQSCTAKAYENGIGVVEDLSEAYTWYALACQTGFADAPEAQKAEETRGRVKDRLMGAYPHPTEEELDDQVNAQKTKIAEYQAEIKKIK